MTEESNISSILTQYLRHELSPTRMSEIKHLITTDPTWIKEYQSILSLTQGIRHTTLRDLQSTLKNLEKTITPSGDLSPTPTYIYESNETSGLETTPLTPRDGHEAPDTRLTHGIRYTTLQDELKKLKKIENTVKEQTEQNTKKNERAPKGARVIEMKWWAVAAGIAIISFGYFALEKYLIFYENKNAIIWTHEEFDKFIFHDTERGISSSIETQKLNAYNLFYLKEFRLAQPKLDQLWKNYNDTLAFYYSTIIDITYKRKSKAIYKLNTNILNKYSVAELIQKMELKDE